LINRVYNVYRSKKGLPYYSLSQRIKQKVKSAISYVSSYENELVELAKTRRVDGIICGHIHQAADRQIDGIHYLNSGDWVETMSALIEHEDGKWEVYYHMDETAQKIKEEMQTEINPLHPVGTGLYFNHVF
jgi:UDP-2,3-diacylglucosamine pyrophosphatase LpxH